MPDLSGVLPATAELDSDDIVLPFRTLGTDIIGRVVRLGGAIDRILARHDAPEPVSEVLGQAVVLAALLGTALKVSGKLIVQTKTDGVLNMLVADCESPGRLRGFASYDAAQEAAAAAIARDRPLKQDKLLGSGHFAITIDLGGDGDRYQGIVALEETSLTDAALTYFHQSEQIPTFLRLAVARHYAAGDAASGGHWRWRAGGMLIQQLPKEGGQPRPEVLSQSDEQRLDGEDNEAWMRARFLAETLQDHELIDPMVTADRLLYRLFHEEGVRAGPAQPLTDYCSCSRERIAGILSRFDAAELADVRTADGGVAATCEFCGTEYAFAPGEEI